MGFLLLLVEESWYSFGTDVDSTFNSICVRQEAGACFIAYLAFPAITGFGFSGTGSPFAFNGPADCSEDFVFVPNSANIGSSVSHSYYNKTNANL